MILFRFFIVFLAVSCAFGYKRHGRIVGGKKAPVGKFPYQASVQINGRHLCGGSVISNRWILTAAHCILPKTTEKNYSVLVGTVILTEGGDRYPIKKMIRHQNFTFLFAYNDVGLLNTETEISLGKYVSPIALGVERVEGGVDVIVSGWGMTSIPNPPEPQKRPDELFYIKLRTISHKECYEIAQTTAFFEPSERSHLCTLTDKGKGACFGDSGGPLVNKDHSKLVGTVSGGMIPQKCATGAPDFFARVSTYIDWIEETMKENS